VERIKKFDNFLLVEKKVHPYYHDELNPKFWTPKKTKDGEIVDWEFDPVIKKKLVKIAKEFYEKFEDTIGKVDIKDIQLTGSLANFNYTKFSDLDVHVLIEFSDVSAKPKKVLKAAIDGIRFIWNMRHDIKMRGHDVELYLQDAKEPHVASGLYSLMNDKWIKKPKFDIPTVDKDDVDSKSRGIKNDIDKIAEKLSLKSLTPEEAKEYYKKASKIKDKIQKQRKEGLEKSGEFSVGNLVFKDLRNTGYIEKVIDIISEFYDKIYSE
jgi:hypothetical protein